MREYGSLASPLPPIADLVSQTAGCSLQFYTLHILQTILSKAAYKLSTWQIANIHAFKESTKRSPPPPRHTHIVWLSSL